MRASLVIAAHNEGGNLARTVVSCRAAAQELGAEIVVADDASTDGSLAELSEFPEVRVVRHPEQRGVAPTKDLGGRAARGDLLIFLDGHCRPEPAALARLVAGVEATAGQGVLTPSVAALDAETWEIQPHRVGHGYRLGLERFDYGWLGLDELRRSAEFPAYFESPALIGCALAVARSTYERLRGFDPDMRVWGVEDLDFGLKAWLMGHPILHDPDAQVGHRFQSQFTTYAVPPEQILANQMRMARKAFAAPLGDDWLARAAERSPAWLRTKAEALFEVHRASVEAEREYLMTHRVHDEHWYAARFGLDWPPPPTDPTEPTNQRAATTLPLAHAPA